MDIGGLLLLFAVVLTIINFYRAWRQYKRDGYIKWWGK